MENSTAKYKANQKTAHTVLSFSFQEKCIFPTQKIGNAIKNPFLQKKGKE